MYEPCKEYQYNNSAQSRKTRSMIMENVLSDVNVGIGTVSEREIFGDYNPTDVNMGIGMRSAYEFVNECLLPKDRYMTRVENLLQDVPQSMPPGDLT